MLRQYCSRLAQPVFRQRLGKVIWTDTANKDDVAQRDEIRKANYARADWDAHLAKIRPLMVSQETTLLVPSPVAGMCPLAES